MTFNGLLAPSKQRLNRREIYGFDIETYDRNKKFYCASIYGKDFQKIVYDKEEFKRLLLSGIFKNCIFVASNLGFDFFGIFYNEPGFNFIFRGSQLIYAKTFIRGGRFHKSDPNHATSIVFLDTLNYSHLSVEKLGRLIGVPKIDAPQFIGHLPQSPLQKEEMDRYNLRDSEISYKALNFFYRSFERLGATCKLTLPSTAMSLFRNRYLDRTYCRHDTQDLLEIFEGYYGGRTEAFARGRFTDYNYYDFNSLYPSVMIGDFPDPDTHHVVRGADYDYISYFEGMSDVEVHCPYMEYPLLPFRHEGKLVFPTGSFRGWYCHNELRQARKLGYVITKIHKTHYYTDEVSPFTGYIDDLYDMRKGFKQQGSPMEVVVKLLMNSLYGKFGQKFLDKDNLITFTGYDQLDDLQSRGILFERLGAYLRIAENKEPSLFCMPIWAAYITAKARLKLHDSMLATRPLYVDTDSLITKDVLKDSKELGGLKLEHVIKEGVIVKPKFYMINQGIKVKGIGKKMVMRDWDRLMEHSSVSYKKFVKIRESLRRGLIPNEIITVMKRLDLEDNKRVWDNMFSPNVLQFSRPLNFPFGDLSSRGTLEALTGQGIPRELK